MGFTDILSGVGEYFEINDVVSDFITDFADVQFLTNNAWLTDAAVGAGLNGFATALAGGDIGEAMLYGGGASLLDQDMFGDLGNYGSAALRGYGLAAANEGDGWLGAGSGLLGEYLSKQKAGTAVEEEEAGPKDIEEQIKESGGVTSSDPTDADDGFSVSGALKKYGIMKEDGDGTLIGKALLGGAGEMARVKSAEDVREHQQKLLQQNQAYQAQLVAQQEQNRIKAFNLPNNMGISRR